jgi:hypothetical protein
MSMPPMSKSPSSTDPHGHCEAQKVVGIDGSLVATQIRLSSPWDRARADPGAMHAVHARRRQQIAGEFNKCPFAPRIVPWPGVRAPAAGARGASRLGRLMTPAGSTCLAALAASPSPLRRCHGGAPRVSCRRA